jgi:hypothetical protein
MCVPIKTHHEYTAIRAQLSRREATAILLPQLISALPSLCLCHAPVAPFNALTTGAVAADRQESNMKMRVKPAVFEAQKVTSDMLMLALQALIVGAAAAMLSGLLIAAAVSLMS